MVLKKHFALRSPPIVFVHSLALFNQEKSDALLYTFDATPDTCFTSNLFKDEFNKQITREEILFTDFELPSSLS